MAASACCLAFVGEPLQLIKTESSFKLTEKSADFRYSVAIMDMSGIGQGRQIWEGGKATTVNVGWFAGRTCQNHKRYT